MKGLFHWRALPQWGHCCSAQGWTWSCNWKKCADCESLFYEKPRYQFCNILQSRRTTYFARRLDISRFSAALWSPATDTTKKVKTTVETVEILIVLDKIFLDNLDKEQQAEPNSASYWPPWRFLALSTSPPKLGQVAAIVNTQTIFRLLSGDSGKLCDSSDAVLVSIK